MSSDQDMETLLMEGIENLMSAALRITLEKKQEPTFRNILHVVATYGHHWFLDLTTAGSFVSLSTGWMYVRNTNTAITDNSTMDHAVLYSLRSLSSFTKGVDLPDLSAYIAAAFRLPEGLSSKGIMEKAECSINVMKVWGKVIAENQHYKLPEPVSNGGSSQSFATDPESKVEITICESPTNSDSLSLVDSIVKHEEEQEDQPDAKCPESGNENVITSQKIMEESADSPEPSPETLVENDIVTEKANSTIGSDRDSISSVTSTRITPCQQISSTTPTLEKHLPASDQSYTPFRYLGNFYKLFVAFHARTIKRAHLNQEMVHRLFEDHDIKYKRIYFPHMKPQMAFVEVEKMRDGFKAMAQLQGCLRNKGAFKVEVKWAKPTERDLEDVRYARRKRWSRSCSHTGPKTQDRRSLSLSRRKRTRSPSTSSRTKRRRSHTRSPRRRSHSRSHSRRTGTRRRRSRSIEKSHF